MQKYEIISLTLYDHLENTLEIYIYSYIQKYLCLRTPNWNVELAWSFSVVSILLRYNSSLPSFTNIW